LIGRGVKKEGVTLGALPQGLTSGLEPPECFREFLYLADRRLREPFGKRTMGAAKTAKKKVIV